MTKSGKRTNESLYYDKEIDDVLTEFATIWPEVIVGWQSANTLFDCFNWAVPYNADSNFYNDFFEYVDLHPLTAHVVPLFRNDFFDGEWVMDRSAFQMTDFYNLVFRERDARDRLLATRVFQKGSDITALSAHLPAGFSIKDTRRFVDSMNHANARLQTSFRFSLLAHQHALDARNDGFWLEQIGCAAFVVDTDLRLIQANSVGEAVLSTIDGLLFSSVGGLAVRGQENRNKLLRLTKTASEQTSKVGPVRLFGPDLQALVLFAQRVDAVHDTPYFLDPYLRQDTYVLLQMIDTTAPTRMGDPMSLVHILGVTHAQARILAKIAEGNSIKDAATQLGITYHTARNHIANSLSRSGMRSQRELFTRVERVLSATRK